MRKGITVTVNASDRARLEAVVANRNSPQNHVWRCRIVLLTADGLGTAAIMQRTGKSNSKVDRQMAEMGQTRSLDGVCSMSELAPQSGSRSSLLQWPSMRPGIRDFAERRDFIPAA